MNNNLLLIGIYKGLNNNHLLLEMTNNSNSKIIELKISKNLKKQILQFLDGDNLIGIRGYVEFNDIIELVATKIFLLSNN